MSNFTEQLKKNPWHFILSLSSRGFLDWMSDNIYLKVVYLGYLGEKINLDNPKKFNEKIQFLKLYDRKVEYINMVDKYEVKTYVSKIIGDKYIIPTLGIYDHFDEIVFDKLPKSFVLKCTHDSGNTIIVKDKNSFNKIEAKKKLESGLQRNFYKYGREWPYKNVPPRIIVEKYMKDSDSTELKDYKFYCFSGKPIYCQVISDRNSNETIDFFDMDWNHQEFTGLAEPHKPFSNLPIPMPNTFKEMKKIAGVLSKDIPFLRVDFYEINGNLFFGELTFYPASGFGKFKPEKYNEIIGDMIELPDTNK